MLQDYAKKRNFKKTPEPKGKKPTYQESSKASKPSTRTIYVIQEHHASHLHFDLRLESRGVLKSWAVPKGMPLRINEKHLAVETEDHPLAYADFKGVIPEGEYGAGTVKIHDKGFFENLTHDKDHKPVSLESGLKKGHIVFRLQGKRYKNKAFILHRFKQEKKSLWLLLQVEK